MHDRPYLKGAVGPEITAAMTVLAHEVKRETGLVVGIQVLAAANREALAVALASGAEFVRVEGFIFAHVADEGVIESCAGELLRYRHDRRRAGAGVRRHQEEARRALHYERCLPGRNRQGRGALSRTA